MDYKQSTIFRICLALSAVSPFFSLSRSLVPSHRFYSKTHLLFPLASYVSVSTKLLSVSTSKLASPVGVVLGLIFVEPSNLHNIPGQFSVFFEDYDISLSLPQINLSRIQAEWKMLISTIPEPWALNTDGQEFQVGDAIKARGLEVNHPVVLIPGVISTVHTLLVILFRFTMS